MCGIAGKLNFSSKNPVSLSLLQAMSKALKHRGPDDEGFYVNGNIGMAHSRLKIIDTSDAARQPMVNEDGTCRIVCNGEIYNFRELRKELIKKGHSFVSGSDTEVILHLYEDYGEMCLKHLRGAFAFAIWDEKNKKLFLARDRLGKKPLKYFYNSDFFIFASELKAMLKDGNVPKEPDFDAIHHYLAFQFAPSPLTGFKSIKKLPPACYLVCQEGKVDIVKYWSLSFREKYDLPEKEWQKLIIDKLRESVELRMVSDVPLGAFLSGGIDSSAIVALMSEFSDRPVKTFSIGFGEKDYNELAYAKMIAKRYKTDHHEFVVKPDAIDILPRLAYYYEEPFADSSCMPSFYLSKLAKEHVTVALNGDGGDENFAGYNRYNALKVLYYMQKAPRFSHKSMGMFLTVMARVLLKKTKRSKAIKFIEEFPGSWERWYFQIVSYFNEEERSAIYSEGLRGKMKGDSLEFIRNKFAEADSPDFLDKILYTDINFYLPEDLLVKMDIATMANAVEARSPLLDHEFMEFTARIPSRLKLRGRDKKHIFKKALKGILPGEILSRKKMGFGIPVYEWFRKDLRGYAYGALLGQKFLSRGLFDKGPVKQILDDHSEGRRNNAYQIWALLFLENWFQQYFD